MISKLVMKDKGYLFTSIVLLRLEQVTMDQPSSFPKCLTEIYMILLHGRIFLNANK